MSNFTMRPSGIHPLLIPQVLSPAQRFAILHSPIVDYRLSIVDSRGARSLGFSLFPPFPPGKLKMSPRTSLGWRCSLGLAGRSPRLIDSIPRLFLSLPQDSSLRSLSWCPPRSTPQLGGLRGSSGLGGGGRSGRVLVDNTDI